MTASSRQALVVLLLVGTVALSARALGPRPALGPPVREPPCAVPVEHAGAGVVCDGAPGHAGEVVGDPARVRMAPARLALFGVPVDVNRATAAELESLPGVGASTARRIVDARPYRSLDDLRRVPGLGARRLARLRPRLAIGTSDGRAAAASDTMKADDQNDESGPQAASEGAQ